MKQTIIIVWLSLFLAFAAQAVPLGSPAPKLDVSKWIKGAALDVTDGKNIYVVEVWATWCGPCRILMPHVSELQKKYKDKHVKFIGITSEAPEDVIPFVKEMGSSIAYTIACDNNTNTVSAYMRDSGAPGIPHAFIISKSAQVIWSGSPVVIEEVLEAVLANKYDLAQAIKSDREQRKIEQFLVLSTNGDLRAQELAPEIIRSLEDRPRMLAGVAFDAISNPQYKYRNFIFAEAALNAAEKNPGKELHFIKAIRSVLMFETGKVEEGQKLINEAIDMCEYAADIAQYKSFKQVMKARLEEVQKKQP